MRKYPPARTPTVVDQGKVPSRSDILAQRSELAPGHGTVVADHAAGELGPVEDDLAASAYSMVRADEQERQGDRGACQRDVAKNTAGYPALVAGLLCWT
jgi:hypothetical protein